MFITDERPLAKYDFHASVMFREAFARSFSEMELLLGHVMEKSSFFGRGRTPASMQRRMIGVTTHGPSNISRLCRTRSSKFNVSCCEASFAASEPAR